MRVSKTTSIERRFDYLKKAKQLTHLQGGFLPKKLIAEFKISHCFEKTLVEEKFILYKEGNSKEYAFYCRKEEPTMNLASFLFKKERLSQKKRNSEEKQQQEVPILEKKFKTCSKCGRLLPIDNFFTNNATKDKLSTNCKECALSYQVEFREKKKSEKSKKNKKSKKSNLKSAIFFTVVTVLTFALGYFAQEVYKYFTK
jgi:RNase P subunit RPR2